MKLVHPETGDAIETTEQYEEMYRSQGWVTPAEAKTGSKTKQESGS